MFSCPVLAVRPLDECRLSRVGPAPLLAVPRASSPPNGFPEEFEIGFHPIRPAQSLADTPASDRCAAWVPGGRLPSTGTTRLSPQPQLLISRARSASWDRGFGRAQS